MRGTWLGHLDETSDGLAIGGNDVLLIGMNYTNALSLTKQVLHTTHPCKKIVCKFTCRT